MAWELTEAELKAIEAQNLPSFPVNIEEIRRTVSSLLSEFGRYGFFDEYTVHSFDHVHEMLKCLDWLIPDECRPVLTSADWFMLTLACYLHDLGLLITRDEFESRDNSNFRDFCANVLFTGPDGEDYRAKVNELEASQREKFLYQEFVRYNHASRVRSWIIGKPNSSLGQAQAAAQEIERLLAPLDEGIRADLANVCESHNLDDLDDQQKYPLFRPYGRLDGEAANLQYVGLILRTTDLIQITNQRAPTVLFKTINPKDPISQVEWLKQNAVKHLRPKPTKDRSGEVIGELQSDTIEVYANFKHAEGFFGLTSYLRYAEKQLQASFDLNERSKKKIARKYSFSWRYIDDSHIKAEGFIPRQFAFELDQTRILDLLTGHTLYNDSAVVLRELTQNAIDAVRFQSFLDGTDSEGNGKVEISWNGKTAELEITDNGTGMTQEVIERHLLKVGSSRYQDPKFKEDYPAFSPISRFGIGVLSAFMVADHVEIVTCTTTEDKARQISLRSVHGRYLIRLLEKGDGSDVASIYPHGTKFKLKLRASAVKVDVSAAVKQWILFPKCRVTVRIDERPPEEVGFDSPRAALEYYLRQPPLSDIVGKSKYRVEQAEQVGLTLAYALRFDPVFHDWTFVAFPRRELLLGREEEEPSVGYPGFCLEGIAVKFASPGFEKLTLAAIANATGPTAPKTNVARSSLENTPESYEISRKIYNALASQISMEMKRLVEQEGYSLSWAVAQMPYLVGSLTERDRAPTDPRLLDAALGTLPVFLIEEGDRRTAASVQDLRKAGSFWSVHSPLARSLEYLVREMPTEVTARSLLQLAKGEGSELPTERLVTNLGPSQITQDILSREFEVGRIVGYVREHRLDLEWAPKSKEIRWISSAGLPSRLYQQDVRSYQALDNFFSERRRSRRGRRVYGGTPLAFSCVAGAMENVDDYLGVEVLGSVYIRFSSKLGSFLRSALEQRTFEEVARAYVYVSSLQTLVYSKTVEHTEVSARLDQLARELTARGLDKYTPDWAEFRGQISAESLLIFDPFVLSERVED